MLFVYTIRLSTVYATTPGTTLVIYDARATLATRNKFKPVQHCFKNISNNEYIDWLL